MFFSKNDNEISRIFLFFVSSEGDVYSYCYQIWKSDRRNPEKCRRKVTKIAILFCASSMQETLNEEEKKKQRLLDREITDREKQVSLEHIKLDIERLKELVKE